MRGHSLAVQASVSPARAAQAAVVGIAITDRFELFVDTLAATRKVHNLRRNPRIAFVIGELTSGDERTVQDEGVADEPAGTDLARLKELYFGVFPDGPERQSWPASRMCASIRPGFATATSIERLRRLGSSLLTNSIWVVDW